MRVALGVGLLSLMLGACGDPASETPVELKPGLYDGSAMEGQVKDRRDGSGPETGNFTVIGNRVGNC